MQEKQKEVTNGAATVPVAPTISQPVTVDVEQLTGEQKEKLIAAIIAPPGSRPQTVPVPVRVLPPTAPLSTAPQLLTPVPAPPTAAVPALSTSISAPSTLVSAPSTSVPAPSTLALPPSETTPTSRLNPFATMTRASQRTVMPIVRPAPSQQTVAPLPKRAKASVEPTIKQEEGEDDEDKFREMYAVWDLRKQGKALQTPKKKKEVINLGMVTVLSKARYNCVY